MTFTVIWLGAGVIAMALLIAIVAVGREQARRRRSYPPFGRRCRPRLPRRAKPSPAQLQSHDASGMTQQLGQVRQEVQTGVASTGQLATDAQREVAQKLQASTEALLQMSQKIGQVQQSSQDLSKATQTLQSVLGGAKTRGTLGEVTLETPLGGRAAAGGAYAMQYRFASTGAIVDAIVRTGEYVLSIDSKFPLEAYRRLVEEGDDARRDFCDRCAQTRGLNCR